MNYQEQRAAVAEFMRRLYRQGLTTTSGGNISMRVDDQRVLLTASKFDKAELQAEHVGILTLDGDNLTPDLSPSIESGMHLSIYRARADVRAVVHAHPLTATAFCATGKRINTHLLDESYAILGDPTVADYARMGTPDLAANVMEAVQGGAACVMMRNHGVLAVGTTLLEAFDRLEVLERAAQTTMVVNQIGDVRELSKEQLGALDRMMER
jgi:L-fuculose-phosphate aldolase